MAFDVRQFGQFPATYRSRNNGGVRRAPFLRGTRMACKVDRVLVLGIGNTLLSDEGAGVHAVRQLQASAAGGAGIDYMDGGTLSFTLAGPIEESDAVVIIDAADFGAAAGTVRVFEGAAMDDFLGTERKRSVHEVGLRDLMAVAALAGHLPERRALIGIQPLELGWGDAPSPRVAEGISRACAHALEIIQRWHA
jgi:hydrogenase maturation protease